MSAKEYERISILEKVLKKQMTQLKAAELLGISDRQVRTLLTSYKKDGQVGILSKKRGKTSNRRYNDSLKSTVLTLLATKEYENFGPTFATEKLKERNKINLSKETVRKWMMDYQLWFPKKIRKKIHASRPRKEYFGEMLQGDGSFHDWFSNGNPCALVYFIDDATSMITAARFIKRENLEVYVKILEDQVRKYGRPWSLYTDRFSVFESQSQESLTQFKRMVTSLEIKWIGAWSPQAKGRIERCNRTLQDRLVKELRLRNIQDIEKGNAFLEEYLSHHNKIFSKKAVKEVDLHRPLDGNFDLIRALSKYEERITRNDFTFQLNNTHYKILEKELEGKRLEIRTNFEGKIRVFQGAKELKFVKLEEFYEEQKIQLVWENKKKYHPPSSHFWKRPSYDRTMKEKNQKYERYYDEKTGSF